MSTPGAMTPTTMQAASDSLREGSQRKSRLAAAILGFGFLLFGALHALPGMIATSISRPMPVLWAATSLWTFATVGFGVAAYGLWGFPAFYDQWRRLSIGASVASLVLIAIVGQARFIPLAAIDLCVFLPVLSRIEVPASLPERRFLKVIRGLGTMFLLYGASVVALHPWYQNWGATKSEIRAPMVGDPEDGSREHLINHVVTVKANPGDVWKWLVQLGQDRAGFYSYDFLERLAGTRIHNVYEVRPEWQSRNAGDFVRSVPADWMGGRWAALTGWKVGKVVPNELLYLENWGPMWIQPQGNGAVRLGVRTDVGDVPFLAAPIELFLFEPIHFVMEQRMLLTIKRLAEH